MGRPAMSPEEKEKAAKKRAWLRARGMLPARGTVKRSKRIARRTRTAKVKSEGPIQRAARTTKPSVGNEVQAGGLLAVSTALHNLHIKFDQTVGGLQAALINANEHIKKLYGLLAEAKGTPLPVTVTESKPQVVNMAPQTNGAAPHVVPTAEVDTAPVKKKGRPAMTAEQKAAKAAMKQGAATPVMAEPIVQEPVAIQVPEAHTQAPAKPVASAPVAVVKEDFFGVTGQAAPVSQTASVPPATKVLSVPESQTYNPTNSDLGLD